MSTARFQPRLSLCLLFAALLITGLSGQGQATISIIIDPPEATLACAGAESSVSRSVGFWSSTENG